MYYLLDTLFHAFLVYYVFFIITKVYNERGILSHEAYNLKSEVNNLYDECDELRAKIDSYDLNRELEKEEERYDKLWNKYLSAQKQLRGQDNK